MDAIPVTIQIGTPWGQAEHAFTLTPPAPVITGVAPTSAPASGGTLVTVTGQYFTADTTVALHGKAVLDLAVAADGTSLTFVTPAYE